MAFGSSLAPAALAEPGAPAESSAQQASVAPPKRRPGLWGPVSSRRMTMPYNSLGLIFGPLQTPLFGQRYSSYAPDAGVGYAHNLPTTDASNELWLRGGVAFGLTPQLEAGALFLTFRLAPDFHYSNFPVYITYHWSFDRVDIGARLSFLTPVEFASFRFNPGMPVLVRLDRARIDTGVFVPLLTKDSLRVGINLPLRGTFNLSPRVFATLETGVYNPAFGTGQHTSSPLYFGAGYTTFVGSRIIDITARFGWDRFINYAPQPGQDVVSESGYQLQLGATFHSKVL